MTRPKPYAEPTLYQKLKAIAAEHPDLLVAYKDDLFVHDRAALVNVQPGDELLWVLRDHGTEIQTLFQGREPLWITYWLTRGAGPTSVAKTKVFHLRVTGPGSRGTVREITHAEAIELAETPAPVVETPHADPLAPEHVPARAA